MTPREAKTFSDYLSSAAVAITDGRSLPFDIDDVCNDLGLQIIRSPDASGPTLGLRGKQLVIGLKPSGPLPLYRFHVAHEIGHALLLREFGALPLGGSEYWQHENLCDFFARRLLLPDVALDHLTGYDCRDARSVLLEIHRLARQYQVPSCDVVAIRFRDRFPSAGVFEITRLPRLKKQSMPTTHSVATQFKVTFSNLPSKKAIGTLVGSSTILGSTLEEFRKVKAQRDLDGALILGTLFPKYELGTPAYATSAFGIQVRSRATRIIIVSNFFERSI